MQRNIFLEYITKIRKIRYNKNRYGRNYWNSKLERIEKFTSEVGVILWMIH